MTTPANAAVVNVVDDDEAVRDSIRLLLTSVGLTAHCYPDAQSFLDEFDQEQVGCLVLDIRMPGMSGLRLQSVLADRGCKQPIIFITGHGDIPMAVEAMRAGAADFIQKPFRDQDLIDRIHEALQVAITNRRRIDDTQQLKAHFKALTDRERDVFDRVAHGAANKEIAYDLGISQRTVEIHRSNAMQKLGARNLAELVRCHVRLGRAGKP